MGPSGILRPVDEQPESMLHPAEHRGYRELYLTSRQLLVRWEHLAEALDGTPVADSLSGGAAVVRELLDELGPRTEQYGLHGGPAAQGAGATLAQLRTTVVDRSVDTGLAARMAVLDVEHLTTLLLQLAELARARGDDELEIFNASWARQMRPVVNDTRAAVVSLGADPDRAGAPLDPSMIGQAFHRAGWAVGTLGEWVDQRVARSDSPEDLELG
jgi:hypothetical protein